MTDGRKDGRTDGRTDGGREGGRDGGREGGMEGGTDGWIAVMETGRCIGGCVCWGGGGVLQVITVLNRVTIHGILLIRVGKIFVLRGDNLNYQIVTKEGF